MNKRLPRLNSLLREVLTEVIRKEVRDPKLPEFVSISYVEISKDLKHAKVHVSVIGDDATRQLAIERLNVAAGYIGTKASKLVVMRFFPELTFYLDETVAHQMHIEEILQEIHKEQDHRKRSS